MVARETMLILLCLFCGALARNDVNAKNIYDLLSKESYPREITINDDAGVIKEFIDDDLDDDLIDATDLELTDADLLKGCKDNVCTFCRKFGVTFCLEAKFSRLGFFLKVTVNKQLLFNHEITKSNLARECKNTFIGRVCTLIYTANIKERSACVIVQFLVRIGRSIKLLTLRIACFTLGKQEGDTPLTFTRL